MLAIRLVTQAGATPATEREAVFGDAGGDIGRGNDCTLALPDPERRISRKHLQVTCRGGRYFLRLISTNMVVELDGVPMVPGLECALDPGSRIRIGPFELQVDGQPAAPAGSARAEGVAPAGETAAGIADDDFSLFRPRAAVVRPSVFHDLLHVTPPAARPDHVAAKPPLEIDLVVGEPTGTGVRVAPPVQAPSAAPPEPAPATADDLIKALYSGLGLPVPQVAAGSVAQVELIGALLRGCVDGTLGLLAARTIAKRELGASPTQIQSRQNNPLKFSPNAQSALAQLIRPPQRGFTTPLAAVTDAFDDLRTHEVALLAGMRAALAAVVDRFSPATIELRLADKGLWDNLLAGNQKARLWDRYREQHAQVAREVEDNFDAMFAGAFIQAYEAQLTRLGRP